jgi:hypothetical protein
MDTIIALTTIHGNTCTVVTISNKRTMLATGSRSAPYFDQALRGRRVYIAQTPRWASSPEDYLRPKLPKRTPAPITLPEPEAILPIPRETESQ